MPLTDVPTITSSVEIDAPPARVWELVGDPRHMSRWSPQTWRSFQRGGRRPMLGARYLNVNHRGLLVWPTQSKVVRYEEGREIAWRVKENWTVWSLQLAPNATGGTTLTQRREAPEGISDLSVRLTDRALGGTDSFAAELERDMARTLERIKADAER